MVDVMCIFTPKNRKTRSISHGHQFSYCSLYSLQITAMVTAANEKTSILDYMSERFPQEEDPVERVILVEQLSE